MVFGLGALALLCLLWLPFALLLPVLLPQRWGQPIGRKFITYGFPLLPAHPGNLAAPAASI
jgi:hypothetical protein